MTLRTTAIIAGVLGLLMLIAGLVANSSRPDQQVSTLATIDTPAVVVQPEVVALQGLERISVTGEGHISAYSARPADAAAWLKHHSATYVNGYDGWDALATRTESRLAAPTPGPAPSGSPSPSAAPATQAASPSPEPTAGAQAPGDEAAESAAYGSTDDFRSAWKGVDRVSLFVSAIAPGDVLVVYAADGGNLGGVEFSAVRQVNDGWIDPLIWIGAALALLGAVAALSGLIDTRPIQERAEGWLRGRSKRGVEDSVRPGSRRERRLAGSAVADVALEETDVLASPMEAQGKVEGAIPGVAAGDEGGAS